MTAARTPAPGARAARACRGARARRRGDTMIEVIVAALLVALVAARGAQRLRRRRPPQPATSASERRPTALAQQDAGAPARADDHASSASVGTSMGNTSTTETVDGTVYTITSTRPITSPASTGTAACTQRPVARARPTRSRPPRRWTGAQQPQPGRGPRPRHPLGGRSLIASASTLQGATGATGPLSGVVVSAAGPSLPSALTTDSTGCAIFGEPRGRQLHRELHDADRLRGRQRQHDPLDAERDRDQHPDRGRHCRPARPGRDDLRLLRH